jgi:hypothetical protein
LFFTVLFGFSPQLPVEPVGKYSFSFSEEFIGGAANFISRRLCSPPATAPTFSGGYSRRKNPEAEPR